MCSAMSDVRFTPNSDRESGHAAMVMSALPLKADMCSAFIDVGLGPEADMLAIATLFDHLVGGHEQSRWQLQSYRLDID